MKKIINFTKMHGVGNDYIYIDCFKENFTKSDAEKYSRFLSDRHFGIGSDGIILILPSEKSDARMRMFNIDGSEGEMCGNALRCVAKYLYENNIAHKNPLHIETGRGVLEVKLVIDHNDEMTECTVDMDYPILEGLIIPTTIDKNPVINHPIEIDGKMYEFTAVSMGNPHAVLYVSNLDKFDVKNIGRKIENHKYFPNKVNVEFVEIISKNEVKQRTWERGSGETLGCGTGASAVCVAGVLTGRTGNSIIISLRGGILKINYLNNKVFMTGGANYSFKGSVIIDDILV